MNLKTNSSKISNDIIWNITSFGGIVIIGVLLNVIILKFYNATTLGVFNQVYAIYILLSQLAVGGVHLSVQFFVPKYFNNKKNISAFTNTALFSALLTSLLIVLISYFCLNFFNKILGSEEVKKGLYVSVWGLVFFSFNKILLSVHNGLRNMKLFGLLQLSRFILILSFLFLFFLYEIKACYLGAILALSEFVLFLILLISLTSYIKLKLTVRTKKIFKIQFKYGLKALTGNFLLDVNTKVDVIVLGLFLSDSAVGVYSLAATVAEGFMQLPVIFRNNINPIITRIYVKKNIPFLEKTINKSKKQFYKIILLLGIVSMLVFPLFPLIFNLENGSTIVLIYLILCFGFIISGGYQPFLMIFNQFGNPGIQTKFIIYIFLSNLLFNLLFIPYFGIYGAAIGTSLSFIVQLILTKFYVKKYFNLTI